MREAAEYRAEHLVGVNSIPLSQLGSNLPSKGDKSKIYILCKTGVRSAKAADLITACGFDSVRVVEGGLDAWKQAGNSVHSGSGKVWGLERQVRFAAGLLVVIGIALSQWVHPSFVWLSAFVGVGLIFAAVTNTCGMGMLLARMPWNR